MKKISNKYLTIGVKAQGAELASIKSNNTGWEYLWQANPVFWKRHSPVLFPIVGSVWNNQFKHEGQTYPMSQHGFARDMDFELISESVDELFYRLESNDETIKLFPFHFELEIGYRLKDNTVEVIWRVKNTGDSELYFQIGAHPAFYYRDFDTSTDKRGYFSFDKKDDIEYIIITEKGCASPAKTYPLALQNGLLNIDADTFKRDALIIENNQVQKVALLDLNQKAYVTLHFDAPLVGLWSAAKENTPFVCIEPWYGRCDKVNFEGEFKNRDWMNNIKAGEMFEASYIIELD